VLQKFKMMRLSHGCVWHTLVWTAKAVAGRGSLHLPSFWLLAGTSPLSSAGETPSRNWDGVGEDPIPCPLPPPRATSMNCRFIHSASPLSLEADRLRYQEVPLPPCDLCDLGELLAPGVDRADTSPLSRDHSRLWWL
jgi:hypothetical protein